MKLELKHLVPYSTYKLNYFVDFEDGDVAVYEMIGMFTDSGEIYLDGYETNLDSKNCKPILRPLSDLTKNIDDNNNNLTYAAFLKLWVKSDVDYVINMPLSCYYDTVEQLFKWHFDVFGLVEKGLAIDINTL
tara:strand:+ start:370 stop:765 length:396 start_codon:yes stop_codon:yes gene_type:complete